MRFDDEGFVQAYRGEAPVGDDPNDLLIRDFGVRNILSKKGMVMWERFIALKVLIPLENDAVKKKIMLQEYMKIATDYRFPKHELLD